MSGRPPKPAALKRLAGNPGKRPIREEPRVQIPARVPYPPRFLNAYGRAEWRRVIKPLIKAGLYSDLDRTILAIYCEEFGTWRDARDQVKVTGGKVLVTDKGYQYVNPWQSIAERARTAAQIALQQFGLSPSSRSKVSPERAEKGKSLAEVLFEKVGKDGN